MKIKSVLVLGMLIIGLVSCKKDNSEKNSRNGIYTLQIDGEEQDITNASGVLDNKFSFNDNDRFAEGLSAKTSIALADNTGVFISFNNDDLNAENVILGDYTSSIDEAFSASDFKFGEVTLSGSSGYFSSLGNNTDSIKLTKCDTTGKKISGEFDAVLTNKENNETIRVVGSFTDLNLVISL